MNGEEIKKGKYPDPGIVAECFGAHAGQDEPGKKDEQQRGGPEKGRAMTDVKEMALAQLTLPRAESVENAGRDVEQPGAKGEKQRREKGHVKMHGAGKEPGPESGDSRRIQAEKVPPFGKIGEALGQVSVYCGKLRLGCARCST